MADCYDVAVVGIGGVFPGCGDLDGFWKLVRDGRSAVSHAPEGRWSVPRDGVLSWEKLPGKAFSDMGCFVTGVDFGEIDGERLGIPVESLDPLFRISILAGQRAFADASSPEVDPERAGVILGSIALPTDYSSALSLELAKSCGRSASTNPVNSLVNSFTAIGLARSLGFRGDAFTLDAACASSLYAIKLACDRLSSGDADLMLAGGVSRPDCMYTAIGFTQLSALSPDGVCAPFDRKGRGLVIGEGAGVFALKRLSDAIACRDHVYGVIRGAGLSNDMSGSLLAPSGEGQLRAMRKAYEQAGWSPSDVELFECHATGTPVGDRVEFDSLCELVGTGRNGSGAVLSSTKSNVGHLLTGAGAAALAKTLLAMKAGVLPPMANYSDPSVPIDSSPFRILKRAEKWESPRKRAAVSAFGFGGINAHLLVEEYLEGDAPVGIRRRAFAPVAVVGIAARAGSCGSADALEELASRGASPERRSFDPVSVPFGTFRIPPVEMEEMLPQQKAALVTAWEALGDSGLDAGELAGGGVLAGVSFDFSTTDFSVGWNTGSGVFSAPLNANRTMGALGSITASRIAREFRLGNPSFSVSGGENGGLIAVMEAARMVSSGELSAAIAVCSDMASDDRSAWCRNRLGGGSAEYCDFSSALVLKRLDDARRDGNKVYAVIDDAVPAFGSHAARPLPVSFGCGDGCADLVLKCLMMRDRVKDGRYLLRNRGSAPLASSASSSTPYGFGVSVAVHEGDMPPGNPRFLQNSELLLFSGKSSDEVKSRMEEALERLSVSSGGLSSVASDLMAKASFDDPFRAAAVVSRPSDLKSALSAFPNPSPSFAFNMGRPSVGGETAFVFPGSGNHYSGMGRDLAARFPSVMYRQGLENERLRDQVLPEFFWDDVDPASIRDNHPALLQGQTSMCAISSDVLRLLGFRPSASIGYSLGEMAGITAFRIWRSRDEMMDRMNSSTLFTHDLAGECRAAAEVWGTDGPVDWLIGVIPCPASRVREALKGRSRVYLLIINTPGDCVIGGDRGETLRLAGDLGCPLIPVEGVTTVHCEVLGPVAEKYRALHVFPAENPEGIRFYSSGLGRSFDVTSESIADSILIQASDTIDFPAVVNRAYEDGVRVFIEVGPGCSCSRMIDSILSGRPHEALFATKEGEPELSTLLNMCARAFAAGVRFDPGPLFEAKRRPSAGGVEISFSGRGFFERAEEFAGMSGAVQAETSGFLGGAAVEAPPLAPAPGFSGGSKDVPPFFGGDLGFVMNTFYNMQKASAEAHASYLALSSEMMDFAIAAAGGKAAPIPGLMEMPGGEASATAVPDSCGRTAHEAAENAGKGGERPFMDREACLEFAVGSIGKVLGEKFAEIDSHPTRVRLPAEPLMLADRIISVSGEPLSMTSGTVVTEHDVREGGWYLDNGVIPTCIAVEAGQSDLFLSGWLGIDKETKGLAVYRLLDAKIRFHGDLPRAGETIRYVINIERFFMQGATWLFYFNFESFVGGRRLMSMTDGCAGFFTERQLEEGKGIIHNDLDMRPVKGVLRDGFSFPVEMRREAYGEDSLEALRRGDLAGAFGDDFAGLGLANPVTLPSHRYMRLTDRITSLDPGGGRYGIGCITAESDIHPDDWFLTCHFSDDNVMPGTLMYECCMHALRIFLMRGGFVDEASAAVWEPIPGVRSSLKCRGQVTSRTSKAAYRISVKEIGYNPYPYALADALMFADGKPVVEMRDMSVQLKGSSRERIEALWRNRAAVAGAAKADPVYDNDSIMAFSVGKPSEAFGDRYRAFDSDRVIARLPGPPYKFLDRITEVKGEKWVMKSPASAVAQYDVGRDEWYFGESSSDEMPFSVLLEVALQPCGWLAAYVGSALTSEEDLSFRNLGGKGRILRLVARDSGMLETRVSLDSVSQSAGMVIQNYTFDVFDRRGRVYAGDTYFGFFSKSALRNQIGIRDAVIPSPGNLDGAVSGVAYPKGRPFPGGMLAMIDEISVFAPKGGPAHLGYAEGVMAVRPDSWFFKAHFYQDPVIPGSLGLESMISLMKYMCMGFWKLSPDVSFRTPMCGYLHKWTYRGQVIPGDSLVTVRAWVKSRNDEDRTMVCDGFLSVDGRNIYEMRDFTIGCL